MNNSKVFVKSVENRYLGSVVNDLMEKCSWKEFCPKDGKVVIKPNLCTHIKDLVECANTSRDLIVEVCKILKARTDNIIIGESNGVRYKTEEAFEATGLYDIARELDIKLLNFSNDELINLELPILKDWPFSKTLLEADLFVNLPVLKTHAMTYFTGALKNLWGCIPQHNRILLHKYINVLLGDITAILKPRINIMDGIICMEGRGPINGPPVKLDILLASNDPVALDATAMRLVGLEPERAKHVIIAGQNEIGVCSENRIDVFKDNDVTIPKAFEPAIDDWAGKAEELISRSRILTNFFLLNDAVYFPIRNLVLLIRKLPIRYFSG